MAGARSAMQPGPLRQAAASRAAPARVQKSAVASSQPLSEARVIRSSDRSPSSSFVRARELKSSRSVSPVGRHSGSHTLSQPNSFAPGNSADRGLAQAAVLNTSLSATTKTLGGVQAAPPRQSQSGAGLPVAASYGESSSSSHLSNGPTNPLRANGGTGSSARFSNVEPMQPLPTRYSTGSYVAPPVNKDGSIPSQTREANEAGGNAVVMNLKSRLEDVQSVLNASMHTQSVVDAFVAADAQNIAALEETSQGNDITAPPDGSPKPESEQTAGAAQQSNGQGEEGEDEEVFVIDEFSWDVYEAAAVLAERIKAAAGMALLRDSLGMSSFSEQPMALATDTGEVTPTPVAAPSSQDSGNDVPSMPTSPPRGSEDTSLASPAALEAIRCMRGLVGVDTQEQPGEEASTEAGDVACEGAPQSDDASGERGAAISGEEVSDTTALVPPRVDSEDSAQGAVLLVGSSEMEETWTLIDGFRVRVEMLPGGLLPERDTIFEELNFLLSGLQNWEPGSDVFHSMPSFLQLAEMVRFSERVRELETHYLTWAKDGEAAPCDDASKQRVCDWLGIEDEKEGEKEYALEKLRSAGARRCKGPEAEAGGTCRKLLRHELYKCNAQRCPLCKRPSKRASAVAANQRLAGDEVTAVTSDNRETEGEDWTPAEGRRRIHFAETMAVVDVEARELAFSLYCGEMNTYYRSLVLPSDIEFGREANMQVTVSWLDGDQGFRQVPPLEVILLSDQWARDAVGSNVAHWDNSVGRLMPGGDANAEALIGVTAGAAPA